MTRKQKSVKEITKQFRKGKISIDELNADLMTVNNRQNREVDKSRSWNSSVSNATMTHLRIR